MIEIAFEDWTTHFGATNPTRIENNEKKEIYIQWTNQVVLIDDGSGNREYIPLSRVYSILSDEE
jgi:hypothetical protein